MQSNNEASFVAKVINGHYLLPENPNRLRKQNHTLEEKKKKAQVFQETNLTRKKALLVTQSRARVALRSKFGLNVYEMPYVGNFRDSFHDIGVLDGAQNRELDTIRYI